MARSRPVGANWTPARCQGWTLLVYPGCLLSGPAPLSPAGDVSYSVSSGFGVRLSAQWGAQSEESETGEWPVRLRAVGIAEVLAP